MSSTCPCGDPHRHQFTPRGGDHRLSRHPARGRPSGARAAELHWSTRCRRGLSLALCLSLTGCAITAQDQPEIVAAPRVSPDTNSLPAPGAVDLSVQVYLVKGRRLARVTRSAKSGPGLEPVLQALGEPAHPDEVRAGLHTSLPESAAALRGTLASSGTATMTLPTGMDRLSVLEQQTAAAQIVFTVTANSLATRVRLVSGGHAVPVPGADGQLIERPLTRADYASLGPPV